MPRPRSQVPVGQGAIIGTNVRSLRLAQGWTQRYLAELLGWGPQGGPCVSRMEREAPDGRRRGITVWELDRLASIFKVPAWQLKTRCVVCDGQPPAGFACLTCGARADTAAG